MYHKRSMSLDTGTREHLIQSVRSPGSSFELSCSSEMLLRMPMTSPQQQQQHVVDVERIAVAVVDMIQYRCTKAIACFLWDLLRYAIFLHVSWILGWALLVALNGFTTAPLCGNRCTIADRVNETLPWHAPDAFFFYLILYVLVLLLTYYLAARRWLTASQHLASRLLKLAAIALLAPAYLSHVFWGPVIFWYANVPYLDFDPTHALLDHQSPLQPLAALKLPNGTMVHLRPSDVALVGNGPLSAEQRAFLRRSAPDQVYRFNGMTNLLPDEPVGHLFVRRIDDVSTQLRARGDSLGNNAEAPRHLKAGDYWGLAPALHRAAVIEWLYVPGVAIVRQRTMCSRAVQAVEVILLNGTHRDAGFYSNFYGLPVRLARASRLARACMPSAHYGAPPPLPLKVRIAHCEGLHASAHYGAPPPLLFPTGSNRALRGPVQGGTALGGRFESARRLDLRFPRVARGPRSEASCRARPSARNELWRCAQQSACHARGTSVRPDAHRPRARGDTPLAIRHVSLRDSCRQ